MEKKREKQYDLIMQIPTQDEHARKGQRIEDRLLQEGERYRDKLHKIRYIVCCYTFIDKSEKNQGNCNV